MLIEGQEILEINNRRYELRINTNIRRNFSLYNLEVTIFPNLCIAELVWDVNKRDYVLSSVGLGLCEFGNEELLKWLKDLIPKYKEKVIEDIVYSYYKDALKKEKEQEKEKPSIVSWLKKWGEKVYGNNKRN